MRIAFFGGSFDPPHAGHLRIALAAAVRLHLDRVLLAPVAVQPLKRDAPRPASYSDRLAMLRLLVADQALTSGPRNIFEVSELDAPRTDNEPNYTYDTLVSLRSKLEPEDKLFMLVGVDAFLTMHHWYRSTELLLLANWIVAARPGFSLGSLDCALPASIHPIGPHVHNEHCLEQRLASTDGATTTLYLLTDLREDVSATAIRAALAETAGVTLVLPDHPSLLSHSVISYIREHALYR